MTKRSVESPAASRSVSPAQQSSADAADRSLASPVPAVTGKRRSRSTAIVWLLVVGGVVAVGVDWFWHHPAQRFRRALAALRRQDFAAARSELPDWPDAPRYEAQRRYIVGTLLLHDGNFALALQELEPALPDSALRVSSLTLSGQALERLGRPADAIRLLEAALATDPDAVNAHRLLAVCYDQLGLIHHSLASWELVAKLAPDDPRPHREIASLHKDFEHYTEAIDAYRESLRRDPAQSGVDEVREELAECEIKQRDYAAALATLEKCVATPHRLTLQAECHFSFGRVAEARRLLDQALQKSPQALDALLLQGTIAVEAGQLTEAIQALSRAVAAHPKDYIARFKLSQTLIRNGEREAGAEHAAIAAEIKRLRDEFTKLHEQAANDPDDDVVRFQLGETALRLDMPGLAENWFRMALALNPQHAAARDALARLRDTAKVSPQ